MGRETSKNRGDCTSKLAVIQLCLRGFQIKPNIHEQHVCVPCVAFQERQKQLESLGISLQSSGIKVGDDKSFLVNLNADPALNELLVYYLKVQTPKWIPPHCVVSVICRMLVYRNIFECGFLGTHTGGLSRLPGHPAVWDGYPGRALCH